ncbi:hypothetical protein QQ045_010390 [Rhodiola kirilowii]
MRPTRSRRLLLHVLGLEINDRPVKRPLVDFEKLSVSESLAERKPEKKTIFVQHVKTVTSSEATCNILKSLVQLHPGGTSGQKIKIGSDGNIFKGESKQDRRLLKAKHEQELVAKSSRFEQIWRILKESDVEGFVEDVIVRGELWSAGRRVLLRL